MSGTGNERPAAGQDQPRFPPPPPGPPPSSAQSLGGAEHQRQYNAPSSNPSQPSFAPPLAQQQVSPSFAPPPTEELYDEPPALQQQQQPQGRLQPQQQQQSQQGRPTSSGKNSHGFAFNKLSSTLASFGGSSGSQSQQGHGPGHGHPAPAKAEGWGERLTALGMKTVEQVGGSINVLANKAGSEGFLPTTIGKECDKAARILRAFCKDGIYTDAEQVPPLLPRAEGEVKSKTAKSKTLLTIPSRVIARAAGLAIFTTVRAGFNVSGSTGSGVIIARLPDGRWSPPSGIWIHSLGAGFLVGLDIYDCVVVINTREALEAFTCTRMSLGSDLAVTAGPWGAGGSVDVTMPPSTESGKKGSKDHQHQHQQQQADTSKPTGESSLGFTGGPPPAAQPHVTTGVDPTAPPPASESVSEPQSSAQQHPPQPTGQGHKGDSRQRKPSPFRSMIEKPVFSYVKSRGFYAGVQIDGTVVMERKDANAAFYGAPVSVARIIAGDVPLGPWEPQIRGLLDVVRGAEGGYHGHAHRQQQHTTGTPAGVVPPTDSMQHMNLGSNKSPHPPPAATAGYGSTAGPSEATTYYPPPPPMTKEQEAAAHAQAAAEAPPPSYSGPPPSGDLPPAYVDDGKPHPDVWYSKTSSH